MEVKVGEPCAPYSSVSLEGSHSAIYLQDKQIQKWGSKVGLLGVHILFSPLSHPCLAHPNLSLQEPRVRSVDQNIPEALTPSLSPPTSA